MSAEKCYLHTLAEWYKGKENLNLVLVGSIGLLK